MVNIGHYQQKELAIFWPCKQTFYARDLHEVAIYRAHPLTKPQLISKRLPGTLWFMKSPQIRNLFPCVQCLELNFPFLGVQLEDASDSQGT